MDEEDSSVSIEGGELEGGEGDLLLFWRCLPYSLLPSFKKEYGLWLGQKFLFNARLEERGMRLLQGATSDECSSFSESLGLHPPLWEGSTMWLGASTWLVEGRRLLDLINACTIGCKEGLAWASWSDCTRYLRACVPSLDASSSFQLIVRTLTRSCTLSKMVSYSLKLITKTRDLG